MKITVGLPAYNEEKNIAKIIVQLKKVADQIIVCDDGSTDSTSIIAESLGTIVIKHPKNLGYGSAIRSIFLKAREINSEILVTIDADGQHKIEDIKKHLEEHPEVTFPETKTVKVRTLDEYYDSQYNFLNIDVQGYELEVLKGATKTLENIDAMILEVNRDEVYENCPLIEDIDNFVGDIGFSRVAEMWQSVSWGDALYARN